MDNELSENSLFMELRDKARSLGVLDINDCTSLDCIIGKIKEQYASFSKYDINVLLAFIEDLTEKNGQIIELFEWLEKNNNMQLDMQ